MRKRFVFIIVMVFVMAMVIQVAAAEYVSTGSFTAAGRGFTVRNWISDDRKSAGARTSGGTSTYDYVYATYYWENVYTGANYSTEVNVSGSVQASSSGPVLEYYQQYRKVVSDHIGSYNGVSTGIVGLTVTAGN